MKRIPRVLRAVMVAGALLSCWLVGGAAPQTPDQTAADVAERFGVTRMTTQDLVVNATDPAKEVTTELVLDGQTQRLVMHPHSLQATNMVLLAQQADGTLRYIEP